MGSSKKEKNGISVCKAVIRRWQVNVILLVIALSGTVFSQPACDNMAMRAQRFIAQGDTFSGVTEYLRFVYYCRDSARIYEICRDAALRLGSGGAFGSSAHWYERASVYAAGSEKAECLLMRVIMLMRAGELSEAEYQVMQIDTVSCDDDVKKKWFLCNALLLSNRGQWEKAVPFMRRYVSGCRNGEAFIERWFGKNFGPKKKSRVTARVLHLLLPGAGHAYAGDYTGGVNSLVLCGITGLPACLSMRTGAWIDASLYTWLFSRFYFGGMNVVADKIDKKNDQLRRKFQADLFFTLSAIEKECNTGNRGRACP